MKHKKTTEQSSNNNCQESQLAGGKPVDYLQVQLGSWTMFSYFSALFKKVGTQCVHVGSHLDTVLLPGSNSTSGQSRSWTWDLQISSQAHSNHWVTLSLCTCETQSLSILFELAESVSIWNWVIVNTAHPRPIVPTPVVIAYQKLKFLVVTILSLDYRYRLHAQIAVSCILDKDKTGTPMLCFKECPLPLKIPVPIWKYVKFLTEEYYLLKLSFK